MDYSLLLVVESLASGDRTNLQSYEFLSSDGKEVYHIAIIDYLQKWTKMKRLEQCSKRCILQKDPDQLSAVEPIGYEQRFKSFLRHKVFGITMDFVEEELQRWS